MRIDGTADIKKKDRAEGGLGGHSGSQGVAPILQPVG